MVWPRTFLQCDPDPLMAKVKFLALYKLHSTVIGLKVVVAMSEAQPDEEVPFWLNTTFI